MTFIRPVKCAKCSASNQSGDTEFIKQKENNTASAETVKSGEPIKLQDLRSLWVQSKIKLLIAKIIQSIICSTINF